MFFTLSRNRTCEIHDLKGERSVKAIQQLLNKQKAVPNIDTAFSYYIPSLKTEPNTDER